MNRKMKTRSPHHAALILLVLFLLNSIPLPDVVTAREMGSDPRFGRGLQLFEQREFEKAFRIFDDLFKEAPGDAEVNFFLGRSAFESGNFETAVFAFERILIADPENQRVRLEMARAYLKLGSQDEAARHFRIVLQSNPPESVKANIHHYLAAIEQSKKRSFLNFTITAGINLDDNLYVAPAGGTLNLPGLDDLPVSVNQAESGYYFPLSLAAHHRYYFENIPVYWKTTAQTYHTFYSGHGDLEVDYFGLSTGSAVSLGRFELGLFPEGYFMLLDDSRYSRAFGTTLRLKFFPGGHQVAEMTGAIRKKSFHDTSDRDGLETGIDLKYTFPVWKLIVSPGLEFKRESTDNDLYGYDRLGAGLTLELPLPYRFSLFAGYLFENDRYDAEDPLFITTRRDRTHAVSAGISREFRISENFLCLVGVMHTWETVDSTISLYEYERNVTRFYFSVMF